MASARSQASSSTGHSEKSNQSQNHPVLAVDDLNGHVKFGCLGSFKLGWKRVDNGETEKNLKKPRKRLVKRKVSKEREARLGRAQEDKRPATTMQLEGSAPPSLQGVLPPEAKE